MQSFLLSLFLNKNHHNVDNLWKHYIIKYLGDIGTIFHPILPETLQLNQVFLYRIFTWK